MLFFRQFFALFWKNQIVLSRHWFVSRPFQFVALPSPQYSSEVDPFTQLNLLRCLILPIGFAEFL